MDLALLEGLVHDDQPSLPSVGARSHHLVSSPRSLETGMFCILRRATLLKMSYPAAVANVAIEIVDIALARRFVKVMQVRRADRARL